MEINVQKETGDLTSCHIRTNRETRKKRQSIHGGTRIYNQAPSPDNTSSTFDSID